MNSHPLEVYLHYSRRERSREEVDYRPVPDAPWTVLFKNVTGEGVAVTPKSPGQRRQHGGQVREWMNSWRGNDVPPQVRRLSSGTSTADHSQSHDVDDKVIPGFTELAERSEGGFVLSVHEKETAYRWVACIATADVQTYARRQLAGRLLPHRHQSVGLDHRSRDIQCTGVRSRSTGVQLLLATSLRMWPDLVEAVHASRFRAIPDQIVQRHC